MAAVSSLIAAFEPLDYPVDVVATVNVPGRYALASRLDTRGNRREFACRVVRMSPRAMAVAAPVPGPIGERVITHLERFGKVEGRIVRMLEHGFTMSITATDAERQKLAIKLGWLERHKNQSVPDGRQYDRIVPRHPITTLTLPGGITMSCLVIDMSVSGAAVSADYVPSLGIPLSVGQAKGRVVRRFAQGFAVGFDRLLHRPTLEQTLIDSTY